MLEKVDGEFQGACIPFIDGHGLRVANNRLAFAPDGSLWIGQISFGGWIEGGSGIQRIVFTGNAPMDVYTMSLTRNGFDLTFTQPVDPATGTSPVNYKIRRYRYEYKNKPIEEGVDISTQIDVQDVPVTNAHFPKMERKFL